MVEGGTATLRSYPLGFKATKHKMVEGGRGRGSERAAEGGSVTSHSCLMGVQGEGAKEWRMGECNITLLLGLREQRSSPSLWCSGRGSQKNAGRGSGFKEREQMSGGRQAAVTLHFSPYGARGE